MIEANNHITGQQLELLKSFKYITNQTQVNEVKELLHLYFKNKLDAAIDNVERGSANTFSVSGMRGTKRSLKI